MSAKKNIIGENVPAVQLPDYASEIAEILKSNLAPKLIREKIGGYHENDVASALELLRKDERYRVYSILDSDTLAYVLEYAEERNTYLGELGIRKRAEILSKIEVTDAVEYLKETEKNERGALIELMGAEAKQEIALLISYDEDEIGSRMTTNYIAISAGISVREAMRELIAQAADNDNISTIYVVDSEGALVGGIDLGGVSGVIGTGNGLVRNPALKAAVERRFGVTCRIPDIPELAAYGAALHVKDIKKGN